MMRLCTNFQTRKRRTASKASIERQHSDGDRGQEGQGARGRAGRGGRDRRFFEGRFFAIQEGKADRKSTGSKTDPFL
jgi:hypothetical protein